MGVARIHMLILSFLSAGMWFALGIFEREYSKHMGVTNVGVVDPTVKKSQGTRNKQTVSDVSSSKRVD